MSIRRGFTMVEILVSVAILAVLAGLLVPLVGSVVGYAKRTACRSNLRQIGIAVLAYAGDEEDRLPAARQGVNERPAATAAWFRRLPPYLDRRDVGRGTGVFQCASFAYRATGAFDHASPKSLKMNDRVSLHVMGSWDDEARIALFVDAKAGDTGMGQWGHCLPSAVDTARHRGRVNVLCLDGSTLETVAVADRRQAATAIRWSAE